MPYFKTSQEWLDKSVALLEARPATTHITTRYSLKAAPTSSATDDASSSRPPRGTLVITTYDPASGVTLKYRTTKAAEVSRLIGASLGRLGRGMAGVLEPPVEEAMPDAPVETDNQKSLTVTGLQAQQQPQAQQGSGGGKKKKKGKK